MLQSSLRLRAVGRSTITLASRHQWRILRRASGSQLRSFANKPSIADPKPVVLPGSISKSTSEPLPPGPVATSESSKINPATPTSSTTIPAENVPRNPPPPSPNTTVKSAVNPPPRPPPSSTVKPRRKFLRNTYLTLIILTTLGFGGGVYLSRVNDNFHDFFTEYIPFGEDAVLYFEEREFRQRFPPRSATRPRDTGDQVKIPSQSGVSWKVANERSADSAKGGAKKASEAKKNPEEVSQKEKAATVKEVKKEEPSSPVTAGSTFSSKSPEPQPQLKPNHPTSTEKLPSDTANAKEFTPPEVDQPSRFPPEVSRLDPINIKDANEPLVQDLAKIINDIITVVNADNAGSKLSGTIAKAKNDIANVGDKIKALKEEAQKEADEKMNLSHEDFDRAAKELIKRLEGEMRAQEVQWKDEYESERRKIQESYDEKLKSELQRTNEVNEQRLRNELLEQAVELKKQFTAEVRDRVESERNGRLGKLNDLTNSVTELEKLTGDWNSVVDENLKTQHLHIAVDAVRSSLEKSQIPRPFVRELAALREIASDDPVVVAAIASINPSAYQRGIASSAQLIDRFRRVAQEVRKASLLPSDAGVASHASSYILSKLMFKKKGLATGDDVESILTRTETYLEEGDLDSAAREMNALTGWAKTLSKDWMGEVRKVLEVQQALDVIATEARLQSLRIEGQ